MKSQFLTGFKVRVAASTLVSVTGVIPVNDGGAQPDAIISAAVETYF